MCAFKRMNMDANALFSNGVINVALVAPPELLRHASNILAGVSNSQPPTWTVRVELADLSDARPVWSATQLIYGEFDEPWLVDPKGAYFSVRTGTEISLDPSNREVVVRASSLQSAFVESYRVARHLLAWIRGRAVVGRVVDLGVMPGRARRCGSAGCPLVCPAFRGGFWSGLGGGGWWVSVGRWAVVAAEHVVPQG